MVRLFLVLFAALAAAQTPDPAYAPLEKAYAALKSKDYDHAIAAFQEAVKIAPDRPAMRKDLAYTLLKIGENEAARDQFAEAMRLDPRDDHVALEYAFLCYETRQQAVARRVFDRIRKTGNQTAADAFESIDRPLREGIARWTKALEMSPDNFSAREELARLAEQRDELALAAEHYQKAWAPSPGPAQSAAGSRTRVFTQMSRVPTKRMRHCSQRRAARNLVSLRKRTNCCPSAIHMYTSFSGPSCWTRITSSCAASSHIFISK